MVDPTGEISKSVVQTLRNLSETISNNNLLETVDFVDSLDLSQEAEYLQAQETPKG